ncbi:hypothetical protein F4553_005259 [Allocatelliglobosispora scoriae]|uniref:Peptidase M41 domain-containing protein n=1 Tax=Allocatelliglobosispora scoriae TaxID=643052 RepID=A0A841BYT3_9ACTN|nr:hypothetical protein [Allocatelliglobosispora scoriae]MBB5871880.1 hypothetical protein [Allocatelliglobosispora scoriae]
MGSFGSPEDVARHELGHAVVAVLVGGSFDYVTVGSVVHANGKRSKGHVEGVQTPSDFDQATMLMAGMMATAKNKTVGEGSKHDIEAVAHFGQPGWFDTSNPQSPTSRAKTLVDEHRDTIDSLADRLLKSDSKSLTCQEVKTALNDSAENDAPAAA